MLHATKEGKEKEKEKNVDDRFCIKCETMSYELNTIHIKSFMFGLYTLHNAKRISTANTNNSNQQQQCKHEKFSVLCQTNAKTTFAISK